MSDDHEHSGLQHHVALSERARGAVAIHRLLVSRNIIDADEVGEVIDRVRARTPADGAKVVARAWTDRGFRARLLEDARPAVLEMGYRLTHDAGLAVVCQRAEAAVPVGTAWPRSGLPPWLNANAPCTLGEPSPRRFTVLDNDTSPSAPYDPAATPGNAEVRLRRAPPLKDRSQPPAAVPIQRLGDGVG